MAPACSSRIAREETPQARLSQIRRDIEKKRYEKAFTALEELKYVTSGTREGGEVQHLLGETAFRRGMYPEAESYYASYLNNYPGGPYAERSVYMQAMAKLRQVEKRRIGFFSFRKYIPHDRDISLIREARILFQIYNDTYPDGKWIEEARRLSVELLEKEGLHELEIASFYLKKNRHRSALARAENVLEGDYSTETIKKAREIAREAREALDGEAGGGDPQ